MESLLAQSHHLKIDHCYEQFDLLIRQRRHFLETTRGNFFRFKNVLDSIPDFVPSSIVLDDQAVTIGKKDDISRKEFDLLDEKLFQLCPWRKGPFDFFGVHVDSEWQSWMKWDRFKDNMGDLNGLRVLDIGSSNGYYMFRMAAHNPLMILGVEPQSSFYYQYLTVQKFAKLNSVFCLPVPFQQLPRLDQYFDRVFCMGVLYHRKSPVQMLKDIHEIMRPGGMLILENLVLETKQNLCLFPEDRYAKMRNVYFIPDLLAMESWLLRAGFKEIDCVDVSRTTHEEQRKTRWIQTETLKDFLDPEDDRKTIEGYPAPVRAVFTAKAVRH
jgi:tRNA (mo5U34)-methyltransferase